MSKRKPFSLGAVNMNFCFAQAGGFNKTKRQKMPKGTLLFKNGVLSPIALPVHSIELALVSSSTPSKNPAMHFVVKGQVQVAICSGTGSVSVAHVEPNPSLKWSANGSQAGPRHSAGVHFL